MPRYSARHYEDTARVIRDAANVLEGDTARTAFVLVLTGFANLYREDNPSFDVERFHKAAFGAKATKERPR